MCRATVQGRFSRVHFVHMCFVIMSKIINQTSALDLRNILHGLCSIRIYSLLEADDSRGKILLYFFTGLSLLGFSPP